MGLLLHVWKDRRKSQSIRQFILRGMLWSHRVASSETTYNNNSCPPASGTNAENRKAATPDTSHWPCQPTRLTNGCNVWDVLHRNRTCGRHRVCVMSAWTCHSPEGWRRRPRSAGPVEVSCALGMSDAKHHPSVAVRTLTGRYTQTCRRPSEALNERFHFIFDLAWDAFKMGGRS